MSISSWIKSIVKNSAATSESKLLIRELRDFTPASIVEVGIGDCALTLEIIKTICKRMDPAEVKYTGIDLFEADPEGASIKETHRIISGTQVKCKLVPGDPHSGLSRTANSLTDSELILIGDRVDSESLDRAWFFFPRMMNDSTRIYRRRKHESSFKHERVDSREIHELAQRANLRAA